MPSKIEWTDESWNPVTGCTPISEGCAHCYAKRAAEGPRLRGKFGYPADEPFRVTVHPDKIEEPRHWRKPRKVFICSMGDLFHDQVPQEVITAVLSVIWQHPEHIFQVLTKRPQRMNILFSLLTRVKSVPWPWPIPNLWLGVTCENQARADERIPLLLQTPAAVRFVSVEPMLGPLVFERWLDPIGQEACMNHGADERHYLTPEEVSAISFTKQGDARCMECGDLCGLTGYDDGIDWVICGGETGPGARPMKLEWARSLRDQCKAAGVPYFFKKVTGGRPIPDDLMIREFPKGVEDHA